jgi:predicted nucleotidyltransferase
MLMALRRLLQAEPNIAAAYLFGSHARGQPTPMSDLDVAVLLAEPVSPRGAGEYQLDLMGRLDDLLHRNAEVVVLNFASPLLAHEVVAEGILLLARDAAARLAFESRARRMYFDFAPVLEAHTRAVMLSIKEEGLGARRRRHQGQAPAA